MNNEMNLRLNKLSIYRLIPVEIQRVTQFDCFLCTLFYTFEYKFKTENRTYLTVAAEWKTICVFSIIVFLCSSDKPKFTLVTSPLIPLTFFNTSGWWFCRFLNTWTNCSEKIIVHNFNNSSSNKIFNILSNLFSASFSVLHEGQTSIIFPWSSTIIFVITLWNLSFKWLCPISFNFKFLNFISIHHSVWNVYSVWYYRLRDRKATFYFHS